MRPCATLISVLATLLFGGSAWAQGTRFPPPVVSVSTITLRDPDSIAVSVRWSRKCVFTQGRIQCPTKMDALSQLQYGGAFQWLQRRSRTGATDTVRFAKPICPAAAVFIGSVAAEELGTVERSDRASSRISIRCRPLRLTEMAEGIAFEDSFPKANRKIVFGTQWGIKIPAAERGIMLTEDLRTSRTSADSVAVRSKWAAVAAMPDSTYTPPKGDTLSAMVGFQYPVCWLGKNRYTGTVSILQGDAVLCEAARLAFASQRSS